MVRDTLRTHSVVQAQGNVAIGKHNVVQVIRESGLLSEEARHRKVPGLFLAHRYFQEAGSSGPITLNCNTPSLSLQPSYGSVGYELDHNPHMSSLAVALRLSISAFPWCILPIRQGPVLDRTRMTPHARTDPPMLLASFSRATRHSLEVTTPGHVQIQVLR